MSADNYYIIRKDFSTGEFVPVMGFASDDFEPEVSSRHNRFPTLDAALNYAHSEWTEYGVSVHPECYDTQQSKGSGEPTDE